MPRDDDQSQDQQFENPRGMRGARRGGGQRHDGWPAQQNFVASASGAQIPVSQPKEDSIPQSLHDLRRTGQSTIRARVANVTLDESTFGVLVRIDEILRWRGKIDDKVILDRISELYVGRFTELLS